jgi:hypothetical protein
MERCAQFGLHLSFFRSQESSKGFRFPKEARNFYLISRMQIVVGPTNWALGSLTPEKKLPDYKADQKRQSTTDVKKLWSYTSTLDMPS